MHLTDADLHLGGQVQQFMPWIAVDIYGGINLLFYAVASETGASVPMIRAVYARIPGFSVPLPSGTNIFVQNLTPAFSPVVAPQLPSDLNSVGDYHMIAASKKCFVYVAYMSTEAIPPSTDHFYNVYVRRINVCPADVDASAVVDANDLFAFAGAYSAGDPRADIQRDGVVNAQDVMAFQEAYACGCGAH